MPRLAITWTQAAGGIVSSLAGMTTWERALYQGQLLPPAQQRQLESLISETTGQPIATTTEADPQGYALGVTQLTYKPLGTVWWYRGGTLGYRFEHFYFPGTGLIIALAVNSSVGNNQDDLLNTAISIYQTLEKDGAVHTG